MKTQFGANELDRLFDTAVQALVNIGDVITKIEVRLEQEKPKASRWWECIFGRGPDFNQTRMRLQIDLAVRQDRKETIEYLTRALSFAIGYGAKVVTLSQEEMELLRLYGQAPSDSEKP